VVNSTNYGAPHYVIFYILLLLPLSLVQAFRCFKFHPTLKNLTQFKHRCTKEHCIVHKAKHTSWEMYVLSLMDNTPGSCMEQNMPYVWQVP